MSQLFIKQGTFVKGKQKKCIQASWLSQEAQAKTAANKKGLQAASSSAILYTKTSEVSLAETKCWVLLVLWSISHQPRPRHYQYEGVSRLTTPIFHVLKKIYKKEKVISIKFASKWYSNISFPQAFLNIVVPYCCFANCFE